MTNDVGTLATALYVKTGDLLKQAPHLAPWRPKAGTGPRLTDAELVTLAVMQALPGYTSEPGWLRHAYAHLGHLFRYLPGSPDTTSDCVPRPGWSRRSSGCWPPARRCGAMMCGS